MPNPAAPLPLVLLGIRHDSDGTFVVVDATGAEHHAGDPVGLGKLVARLAMDPEIPRTVPDPGERNPVIDVASRIARKVMPERSRTLDIIEPFAHFMTNKIAEQAAKPRPNPSARRKRTQGRTNRM